MRRNFFLRVLTGRCLETLLTSIGNCSRHDLRLIGQTSVWMFPIYGMACIIKPLYRYFKKIPALFRGFIYSTGIFCFEYLSGSLLKKHHLCPWDYSNAPTNINGVIRLDYAPVWMAAGLIFEKILSKEALDHESRASDRSCAAPMSSVFNVRRFIRATSDAFKR